MRVHSKGTARRKGAAVLEFAIVAPLLFMLIFGMIEFGRAMMALEMITNAAREGARIGVLSGSTTSSITASVKDRLSKGGIATTNATVTVKVNGVTADASTAKAGDLIEVTTAVPYADVSWLPSVSWLKNKNLQNTAAMRHE